MTTGTQITSIPSLILIGSMVCKKYIEMFKANWCRWRQMQSDDNTSPLVQVSSNRYTCVHEFGICWCAATRWAKLEQNLKPQARKTHEHLKNHWSYGVVFGVFW